LTTVDRPNRLHVKRASKIRKLYNLTKEDDVKHYISKIGREIEKKKEGTEKKKNRVKRPKIQRIVTDVRLRRKKLQRAESNGRRERTKKLKEDYHKLLTKLHSKKEKVEEVKVVDPKAKKTETKGTEKKVAGKVVETKKAAPTKAVVAPVKKVEAPVKKVEAPKKADPKKKWKWIYCLD